MAYVNELLYEQEFTGTSFTVTHNLDRLNLDYRIVCSGDSRPDLVQTILFSEGTERDSFDVYLTSSNIGLVQVLDTTRYPVNLPTPENSLKIVDILGLGQGVFENLSVSNQCLTVSSTTVTITGSLNVSGNTLNNIGPFNQTGASVFTGSVLINGVPASTTDSYVTGATLVDLNFDGNATGLELGRNQGLSAVTVDLASINTDTFVTGATLNATTLELGRKNGLADVTADLSSIDGTVTSVGGTGSVNGLILGGTVTDSGNLTLGGTLAINDGDWSGTSLSIPNGGTGQGTPQEAIDALSRVGVATNEYVLTKDTGTGNALWKAAAGGTDSYVTGATLNATTLELERNGGLSAVTVDLAAIDKDRYVTGATLNSTTLELGRNGGFPDVTVDLASIDTNSYLTGATLNSTTLELERNEGLADVTVNLSGLTGPSRFFDVYDNTGGQTFTTGTITVNLDTTRLDSGDGAFTLASDEVTINKEGTYVITYRVSLEVVGSNTRSGGRAWLEIDTGGGFSEVDGSRAYTYNRQQGDSENTAVAMVILDLNVGDELRVRAARQHGSGTLSTIADSSSLSIFTAGSQGAKGAAGEKGDTGAGSNIIVQKDDSTVGTVTDTLNFEGAGVTSAVDEGSNKTTVTIGGGVYGTEYDYNEDDTTSTTDLTSYQLKVTLTTASLPAGNYEISWYSETNQSSTAGAVDVRVQYGTTEIGQTEIEHEDVDDWNPQGGFKSDISLSGTQTIELHYRVSPDTSGGDAAIRRARLKIIRVS